MVWAKGLGTILIQRNAGVQAEHLQGIAKLEIPINQPGKATARRCDGQVGHKAKAAAEAGSTTQFIGQIHTSLGGRC